MTELEALGSGGKKTVIYFTQGNGELDLADMNGNRADVGAGLLKERLLKRNFEVEALNFVEGDNKWMDKANIVVIAGPRIPFPDHALKTLRDT